MGISKNKTWRIIYPDKTESLMNYDPIKKAEKELKRIVKEGYKNGF